MEYGNFLLTLADNLPDPLQENTDFVAYLKDTPEKLYDYADMFMMTLPAPRTAYYESSNFSKIQANVLSYTNQVTDALGFYPIVLYMGLVGQMEDYSQIILFVGIVFNIIIIMFVIVSILLIYSLLMITVETKTFETGVMRLIGLSEAGFIGMIFMQALMFVLPSVICGFAAAVPGIWLLYEFMFTTALGFTPSLAPEPVAVAEAIAVGFFIPLLSAIIPI